MKHTLFAMALLAAITFALPQTRAQSNTNASAAVTIAKPANAGADKHVNAILTALNLGDAKKEKQVRDLVAAHLEASKAWHATNDAKIKPLWNEFNKARGAHDEAGADAALEKIDSLYATFHPEHEKLIAQLSPLLTPDQLETVEDVQTVYKVKVTYTNYQKIFPGLNEDQKAFILKNLKAARAEAVDAGAMAEKSAFFKKYKIKIEAYLTAQGYDVKKSYQNFAAKEKAASPGKTPAEGPAAD